MNKVRVRYAPSPTGPLHIGGARTALFNYLYAKKHNGTFVVRIEDTDSKKIVEDSEKSQLDNLVWLGILPDESPEKPNLKIGKYRQSERLDIYKKYADTLLKDKHAYFCYCTPEELDKERKLQIANNQPPRYSGKCKNLTQKVVKAKKAFSVIRLSVPKKKNFKWIDMVRGNVSIKGEDFGDWVILKNNGMPTYNFSAAVDDHLFEISHVLRGEEHISNTPKQIHLYQIFGWKIPTFGHMTLVTTLEGKKLSKSDPTIIQFIEQYKNLGYIPEAIFNFLVLLGWSPKEEKEIYSHDQFCKIFDSARLSKSPSKFDVAKLEWINSVYMKNISDHKYLNLVYPFAKTKYGNVDFTKKENQLKLLLYKNEIKTGIEIQEKIALFFNDNFIISQKAKEFLNFDLKHKQVAKSFLQEITSINWTVEEITKTINLIKTKHNVKGKKLFMPIRIATTGQMHGPELNKILVLLTKEKILLNKID